MRALAGLSNCLRPSLKHACATSGTRAAPPITLPRLLSSLPQGTLAAAPPQPDAPPQHHQQPPAAAARPPDGRAAPASAAARVLDGRTVAAGWIGELEDDVRSLARQLQRPPGLSVILVGNRSDSMLYVSKKLDACQQVGIRARVTRLPEGVSQSVLEQAIEAQCSDPATDGVLIQLPLPRHLDEEAAMERLDPRKDVDGFHPLNMGRLMMRGRQSRHVPCTPLGCMQLLRRSGVEVRGKQAVVVGDSNIVGTPLAVLLREAGAAAVTICHRLSYQEWFEDQAAVQARRAAARVCLPRLPGPTTRPRADAPCCNPPSSPTDQPPDHCQEAGGPCLASDSPNPSTPACCTPQDGGQEDQRGGRGAGPPETPLCEGFPRQQLPDLTRTADILVVAVGQPELVKADWVKPGAVVVDVGINVVPAPPGSGARCLPTLASLAQPPKGGCDPLHPPSDIIDLCGEVAGSSTSETGASGGPAGQQQGEPFQVVGDVHFGQVAEVASVITPVPGGVGPMTIAGVIHNTVQAARYHAGLQKW